MNGDLYETIIGKLKDSNLITYFNENATLPPPDSSEVVKLMKKPTKIFVKDNNLCYEDDDGTIVCCPKIDVNVSDAGYWLSDKIDPPSFDILQGGNIRKAEESEAYFICCMIAVILNDEIFSKEIEDLIKSYDFDKMASINSGWNFVNLLREWQDLQSVLINVIVSACKYSISDQKKDSEQFLRSGLLQQERDALRDLELKIKSINFKYSTGSLSPKAVKVLTKIEILKLIQERDLEINKIVSESKYGNLYKTCHLSSEYVSPIVKKKIFMFCIEEAEKMYAEDFSLKKIYGDSNAVVSKLRRRSLKLATMSVIKENIERYVKDREGYVLPRKA